MSRQCERPDCAARASVAYGFDAARRTAWFADLSAVTGDAATAGALCAGHARAMVLPRGWWLDDRRHTDSSTLFAPAAPAEGPAPTREGARADRQSRQKRRARAASTWANVPLPLEAEVSESMTIDMGSDPLPSPGVADTAVRAVAPEGVEDAPGVEPSDAVEAVGGPEKAGDEPAETERVVVPWRPQFDQSDDLGGVLAARSPLLARAFGGLRRSAPQAPRDE